MVGLTQRVRRGNGHPARQIEMQPTPQHQPQVPPTASTPEADREATHRRQVAAVRASLRKGVAYCPASGRPADRKS